MVVFALVHLVVVFFLVFEPVGVGVGAWVGGDAVEQNAEGDGERDDGDHEVRLWNVNLFDDDGGEDE